MYISVKNVQISFDEELLERVDRVAESVQLSRSAAVREALHGWIRQKEIEKFEKDWIQKLKQGAAYDDSELADAWLAAESWSDSPE